MRASMLLCSVILAVSINYATGIFFPIIATGTAAATTATVSSTTAVAPFLGAAALVGLAGAALAIGAVAASSRRRGKRSAEETAEIMENDLVWDLLRALDKYNCGALLVCSLEDKKSRTADEQKVVDLFDSSNDDDDSEFLQIVNSRQYYQQAARLGRKFGYKQCRQAFKECPASPDLVMEVARNLN